MNKVFVKHLPFVVLTNATLYLDLQICAVIAAFGMLSQMKNDVEYEVNEKK